MAKKTNRFNYKTISGVVEGYFDIYQGRSGHIYLMMDNYITRLTRKQIKDLRIDIFGLKNFDFDKYLEAYNVKD